MTQSLQSKLCKILKLWSRSESKKFGSAALLRHNVYGILIVSIFRQQHLAEHTNFTQNLTRKNWKIRLFVGPNSNLFVKDDHYQSNCCRRLAARWRSPPREFSLGNRPPSRSQRSYPETWDPRLLTGRHNCGVHPLTFRAKCKKFNQNIKFVLLSLVPV